MASERKVALRAIKRRMAADPVAGLRNLADTIERGDCGDVLNICMVLDLQEHGHRPSIDVYGFGPDAFGAYAVGLFYSAAQIMMKPRDE